MAHSDASPYGIAAVLTQKQAGPGKRSEWTCLSGLNKTYLLIIDYFYIEVAELRVTSSEATVCAVKEAFAHYGYPETVVYSNGPQRHSEHLQKRAALHVTSNPRY